MALSTRLKSAWSAFNEKDKQSRYQDLGVSSSSAPRAIHRGWSKASVVNTVYNRIALDVSNTTILHVKVNPESKNQTQLDTTLIHRLTEQANIDQTGPEFIHELVYSMLDEGVVAVVPVEASMDINKTDSYEIYSMRVGRITQWYPDHVRVDLYNDKTGNYQEVTLPKKKVAIIQNPLYEITNAKDGMLDRLKHKMELLDTIDDESISNKLNLILQLPYGVKSEIRREQANQRISDLEKQLQDSKYGIAYVDGTEKITQLNRPISSNVSDEVKYLTEQFYNSLGLTQNVFNGTATEAEMRGYYTRTVDVFMKRILDSCNITFLTKTARSQGQKLVPYRDPFELVPVEQLANIADTFSRNAILTSNEIRGIVGFGPNDSPEADELSNKNIADVNQNTARPSTSGRAPLG